MPNIEEGMMKSAELDEYMFHYAYVDGIIVLCMTDKTFVRKQAFAFLQDIKKSLLEYYSLREITNAGH